LDLILRNKLANSYTWRIEFYGVEMLTLRKVDQKYLESFEMLSWRRIKNIRWTDRVRNKEVLHRVKEKRNSLHTVQRRLIGLVKTSAKM
jgi:hypothetical protein